MCVLNGGSSEEGVPKYVLGFQSAGKVVGWPVWVNVGVEVVENIKRGRFVGVIGTADENGCKRDGMIKPVNMFELNLGEYWASAAGSSGVKITAAALVSDKLIAVGCGKSPAHFFLLNQSIIRQWKYLCGAYYGSFFQSLDQIDQDAVTVFSDHRGPVRALYQSDYRATGGKNYLISGGSDQMVKIWDLEAGTLLTSLVCHSRCVKTFAPVPNDCGMKMRHGIISVAEDESIAVIDLDKLQTNYILTGHSHGVSALHWRSLEETLVVQCSNYEGTVYVWQTTAQNCHLDRIEEGDMAADIISCCDCSLVLADYSQDYMSANTKQTFSAFPITAGFNRNPIMFVLLVNLKRFINDVYGGQYSLTPPTTPPHTRREIQNKPATIEESLADPFLFKSSSRQRVGSNSTSMGSAPNSPSIRPQSGRSRSPTGQPVEPPVPLQTPTIVSPKPRVFGDKDLVRAVLSASMSWGLDQDVDTVCQNALELGVPAPGVVVGNRGANGYISVPIPVKGSQGAGEWCLSPTMSASRMLQIVSLLRTISLKKEYEQDVSGIISKFCSMSPKTSASLSQFQFPSFAFLAKYWQDQISDVQQASRTIFSATLKSIEPAERTVIIDYWRSFLPTATGPAKKPTKYYGIFGCEDASLLPIRLVKDVAESLDILLKEDIRTPHRMMAVELLGRGFKTWEPHLNAPNVLKTIIYTTGLQSPSNPGTPSRELSTGAGGLNVPNSALVMISRQAVVQIASINPALFISTVTNDFVSSKVLAERVGGLKLLGMFIAKKPNLLYPHVPRIVEAMVKCLDPNVSGMREAVQTIVTSNFAELVKSFPNVAFHHGSQKLLVGSLDGLTVVYDLKTATKGQVLEGHTKPVTAVAFSPDGKMSVTFSYEENCVRFYQLASGFLNTLAVAFGGGSPGSTSKAGHMKSFREFSVGPEQKPNGMANFEVKFEWLGERSVKLHSTDEIKLVFTV
ncbi:hypothetical protein BCR33DRAFT_713222 [Rhizoclosmatium globosum]|uniref:WD40 repeat-like protein n=1 Tax=Rhizoclosmatium globosum TaxID=329046 RepID=A0A1Y2CTU9_9FUNG|nr:hypothetical protein BCR33DRAFT_713222 [Rhizoclosmatium globosum]|eukprot:ORY50412.1 hypothetical protein BCR33DRAFT_713222 [Rhizoclosmatium globosum]